MPRKEDIFLVDHDSPEVLAYSMAKYSRSAQSLQDTIQEVSSKASANFLNTFYFQYGHRSIADMAHLALGIERISLLAAMSVVDEPRWDGQERSTRYQDFSRREHFKPQVFKEHEAVSGLFDQVTAQCFEAYEEVHRKVFQHYCDQAGYLPVSPGAPAQEIKQNEKTWRTLQARTFDIARYMLPLSTLTSVGQITSGRTLEGQISRLRSSPLQEIKLIGDWLAHAASDPAKGCPTLVKYAEASEYQMETHRQMAAYAASIPDLQRTQIATQNSVDMFNPRNLEIELVASLLYPHSKCSYREVCEYVSHRSWSERKLVLDLGLNRRGQYDELPRPFQAGAEFQFDILMDVGGYRDLHRHRRCTQLEQQLSTDYGFAQPAAVEESGAGKVFDRTCDLVMQSIDRIAENDPLPDFQSNMQYLMPLATRKRALFKMDLAQVVYISELRTRSGGHFSYQDIAWQMAQSVQRRYPVLTDLFSRVQNPQDSVFFAR